MNREHIEAGITIFLRKELADILSAMCFAHDHNLNAEVARILKNEFRLKNICIFLKD